MSLASDRGLAVRMLATLAAVVAANALFVGALVYLAAPWADSLARDAGRAVGAPDVVAALWWLPLAAALVALCVWAQLRYVRRQTLAAVDAERATAETHPEFHSRATRLASQASAPVPALYVAESDVPNSFALGGVGRPALVVSTAMLAELDGDRLDGVLAHELAHLQHRDAAVMTLASFLPALTSDRYSLLDSLGPWARSRTVWTLALAVCYVAGALATGASPFDPGYAVRFAATLAAVVVVGGITLGVLATATTLAARRLSHYREFAADRGGAALTGDPAALADALARLDDETTTAPDRDKRAAYAGVRGLCLLPHGFGPDPDSGSGESFHVETRSHPPTDERIARLGELVERR